MNALHTRHGVHFFHFLLGFALLMDTLQPVAVGVILAPTCLCIDVRHIPFPFTLLFDWDTLRACDM